MCGEKMMKAGSNCAMLGSPPRMRGKASGKSWDQRRAGITPRVCGEKAHHSAPALCRSGSPPRMRGKGSMSHWVASLRGITPAYAGKRVLLRTIRTQNEDHPRVCGEKPVSGGSCVPQWGSPPRMRGKGRFIPPVQCQNGITPAYAGKRVAAQIFRNLNRDHPRVCGEKILAILCFSWLLGSPPRMRGKDSAYNGLQVIRKDHPRVCGEKDLKNAITGSNLGSPPRMRGKEQQSSE